MPRKRQKPAWNNAEGADMDILASALRNVSGDRLRAILKRDKTFTFRLSEMDRDTMERAAKAMELSIAEYILRLHYHAFEVFKAEGLVK